MLLVQEVREAFLAQDCASPNKFKPKPTAFLNGRGVMIAVDEDIRQHVLLFENVLSFSAREAGTVP